MSPDDERMEKSGEEKYYEISHCVLLEMSGQTVRFQSIDMADYTYEEVYIKLR